MLIRMSLMCFGRRCCRVSELENKLNLGKLRGDEMRNVRVEEKGEVGKEGEKKLKEMS